MKIGLDFLIIGNNYFGNKLIMFKMQNNMKIGLKRIC